MKWGDLEDEFDGPTTSTPVKQFIPVPVILEPAIQRDTPQTALLTCVQPGCSYKSKYKYNMTRHSKTHNKSSFLECDHCDKYELNMHISIAHEGKQLMCDQCGKVFSSRTGLTDHKRKFHIKNLPHKCSQCDQAFRNKQQYLIHINSHFGHSLYKCTNCKTEFKQKHSLGMHENVCKDNPSVSKCDVYDKIFTRRNVMREHVRCKCNELRGIMARSTQIPNMITRSTIIYETVSPGAAGISIYS